MLEGSDEVMKKKKPTVRYIKNGVEKVVSLNMFNYSSVCREIFDNSGNVYLKDGFLEKNGSKLWFDSDLEFVHFDNVKFRKLRKFNSYNENLLCIFENCVFYDNTRLHFNWGTYQLINPEFLIDLGNFGYTLEDNTELNVCINNKEKFLNNINFMFQDWGSTYDYFVRGDKVVIGSKEKESVILLDNGWYRNFEVAQLEFINVTLECNKENDIYICSNNLKLNNFHIKTKGKVYFQDKELMKERDEFGYLHLDDKDFILVQSKRNMVSVLKGIRDVIENRRDIQINEYLKSDFIELEEYEQRMKKLIEQELEYKRENIKKKSKKISKSLSHKNIDYF